MQIKIGRNQKVFMSYMVKILFMENYLGQEVLLAAQNLTINSQVLLKQMFLNEIIKKNNKACREIS